MHTSRRLSRESGQFIRVTPGSQSLERGIHLLRAFLEGAPSLSNGELAARTRLPKATVSRLCRSLVVAGLLEFDPMEEAYRLAPSCLSFGRAFQFSRSEVTLASGLLKAFARKHQINVGLSAPDRTHMVYITTFREGRGGQTRTVASGLRLPMATCSPGIAYLSKLSGTQRIAIYDSLAAHHAEDWQEVSAALEQELRDTDTRGYSQATSTFGNTGVGTTVLGGQGSTYGLNASYLPSAGLLPHIKADDLGKLLLSLAEEIEAAWKITR